MLGFVVLKAVRVTYELPYSVVRIFLASDLTMLKIADSFELYLQPPKKGYDFGGHSIY